LGDRGKHLFENVRNSLKRDRRKLLVYRAEKVNDQLPIKPKKDQESDRSVGSTSVLFDSDSLSLSEGEFESDNKLLTKMQVSTPLSSNIDAAGEGKISLLPKEIAPITAGTSTMGLYKSC
jgi:hypothetical protein